MALVTAAAVTVGAGLLCAPSPAQALENGVARTPPMGWNSWNTFGCNISESLIRGMADAIVKSGMRDLGYQYVVVDDCWFNPKRDSAGNLQGDPSRFPSGMKALGDYIHGKGLKFGIYEVPAKKTCAQYFNSYQGSTGSQGHEAQDARQFAAWGVDYLKWNTGSNGSSAMGVKNIIDVTVPLASYTRPGAFNDPDMMEVGRGGMTDIEMRSHFAMWAMMAAPLLAGNDVRSMSSATATILKNQNLIAIDQDPLGRQATQVAGDANYRVLTKRLVDGDVAVALFNAGGSTRTIATTAAAIGMTGNSFTLNDAWAGTTSTTTGAISAKVPSHGTVVYRVSSAHGQ